MLYVTEPLWQMVFQAFFFFPSFCLHPEIDILCGELSKWTTFGNTPLAWSRTVQFVICNSPPVALYACTWLSCSAWVSLLSRWGKALTMPPSPHSIWKVSVPGDVWCACTFPRCFPQPREMVLFRWLSGELWGRVRPQVTSWFGRVWAARRERGTVEISKFLETSMVKLQQLQRA